jgi:prepilin-type N-terminal cleavage/methylation domain-containing protein
MSKANGFSLVELLVVAAIVVLISGIAFVSYSHGRLQARDGERQMVLAELETSLALYRTANYDFVPQVNIDWQTSFLPLIAGKFINSSIVNIDPSSSSRPAEQTYTLCVDSERHKYLLAAFLEEPGKSPGLSGAVLSYSANQCVNQAGLTTWSNNNVCGRVNSAGLYVFCLGAL